ncbi:MAG: glucosaminidase domain-containing protein [Alphaproteobacteria bacterium]|nr:glucosaminidase domain-containing protein [Alphaproteobacteria bacterium]
MKWIHFLILICSFFARPAYAVVADQFIQKINEPPKEFIARPKTTAELKKLFQSATESQVPRVYVEKLPEDFVQNGNKTLYAQVLGALILRENEKAIQDKVVIATLKQKYDQQEPWTETEQAFFNHLVEKYDVVSKKTVTTQLEQLLLKADEVPVGMAIAQSAYDTDWGKKQMESPYGQTGWLDDKNYTKIKFDSLIKATESYVQEMNSTPNYFVWRVQRQNAASRGANRKQSYNFALSLRVYRPEDPNYTTKIRKLILQNPLLSRLDQLTFIQED